MTAPETAPLATRYTSWPSIHASAGGEVIDTTWPAFFSFLADQPPPFAGDQRHHGWSPAIFDPPRRARENVTQVFALVLDYDKGTPIDDALRLWGEWYGCLHTSRSHTLEKPRFRVILPFKRPVTPAEYPRIWKWANALAREAGQELDQAPKDPSRFWYLPAQSPAPYVTHELTGEPIDPDPILSVPEPKAAPPSSAPLATDVERRAALYLARMPPAISGQRGHDALWKAALAMVCGFELAPDVALRLLEREYNHRCDPPWTPKELEHKVNGAAEDATVERGWLLNAKRPELRLIDTRADEPPPLGELTEPPARVEPAAKSWRDELRRKHDNFTILKTYLNTFLIVQHHEAWAGKWAYNEMALTPYFDGRPAADTLPDVLRRTIEREYAFSPNRNDVERAIADVASLRSYHPVRDYLRGLQWDGTHRLLHVARDVLGDLDPNHADMLRKWFISAVARVLEPGCKVDTALILQSSDQGLNKSSFFKALADPWHSDSEMSVEGKDGMLQLHAAWIHEWGELEYIVNERVEAKVKQFLSSAVDLFRAPFARAPAPHPRTSVVVGSTNAERFLTDVTGLRRYWIMTILRLDLPLLRKLRDHLWAEAVAVFDAAQVCAACAPLLPHDRCDGHRWYYKRSEEAAREKAAQLYRLEESWETVVAEWLGRQPPRAEITTWRLLNDCLGIDTPKQDRSAQMRVARVMRAIGYQQVIRGDHDERKRVWVEVDRKVDRARKPGATTGESA